MCEKKEMQVQMCLLSLSHSLQSPSLTFLHHQTSNLYHVRKNSYSSRLGTERVCGARVDEHQEDNRVSQQVW
jgi:hypothetical protein